MKLELITEEGKFGLEFTKNAHLFIDCACGGTNGRYTGWHDKNKKPETGEGNPLWRSRYTEHTLYMNTLLFDTLLRCQLDQDGAEPKVIVCNDCQREFPFTIDSYEDLIKKIMEKRKK